jgi:hypothetical protein
MKTRKRKYSEIEFNDIDWNKMISATKIRNYMLNDPLLDWLKEYRISSLDDKPKKLATSKKNVVGLKSSNMFNEFIMNQGILFEDYIITILKKNHEIIQVAESFQAQDQKKYNDTVELMNSGANIIYQGVLHDTKNNLYGCPDLLVRSDKINSIFGYNIIEQEYEKIYSPNLGQNYYYIVIDIKSSTLQLMANGKNLRNSNSMPAYKAQLYIYNKIVSEIQGFESRYSFILGKKWYYHKNNICYQGSNCLNKLGEIDYENIDKEYIQKTNAAIEWIKKLRTKGDTWHLLPKPSVEELYPNMKNERDGNFRRIKNELNKKISDVTEVWMCGVKKRRIAHENKIFSWKDKDCNAKALNFKNGMVHDTVNQILQINQQNKEKIRVNTLLQDTTWRKCKSDEMEFFIDFETLNSNIGEFESNDDCKNIIFLIGVGWLENNEWKFKKFLCRNFSIQSEYVMLNNFHSFINQKIQSLNKRAGVFLHWTCAEPINYTKALKRHDLNTEIKFYDLYELFKRNKIVINGALNFSLKTISKSLKKYNFIETIWDSNSLCSNGLNAMLLAYKLYKKNNTVTGKEPVMNDIIKYNEIDCKVLMEILQYLRDNY